MKEIRSRISEFDVVGVQVVFLAAQKRTGLLGAGKFAVRANHPFPILLDEDRSVSKAYGVYAMATLSGAVNVARPAAFLIDRQGLIRYRFEGSRNSRPDTDELLEKIKSL